MSPSDPEPIVIAVVDDELLVRMIAEEVLTDEGYHVLEAGDADEALRILEARPDTRVLFTDVTMPGSLNGYALAEIARRRWPRLLVIVASGDAGPGASALPAGARYLQKPYAPSELLRLVQDMLIAAA
ncbi:response regulator [Phenylobacterium hankyongense]|uniref:response regulator n=1 Tax=Phenylobacterium hankyongense TaxID=1813876 RepID=UPI001FB3ED25|nr:response regulator [Phenylobacterium hankyongense]